MVPGGMRDDMQQLRKTCQAVGYYIDITREKNAAIESRANRKALELLREQEERLTRRRRRMR